MSAGHLSTITLTDQERSVMVDALCRDIADRCEAIGREAKRAAEAAGHLGADELAPHLDELATVSQVLTRVLGD